MPRSHRASSYLPLLALIAIFLGVGLLVLVVPSTSGLGRLSTLLWGTIPTAVALWQFAYSRIEGHRLRVNRARFWFTNPEVTWGMTCELDVANAPTAVSTVNASLDARPKSSRQLLSSSSTASVWQLDGLTIRVVADVADDPTGPPQNVLRLEFVPVPRAFRTWKRLLGGTVFELVEQVECGLQPIRRKYVAHVSFPRQNPYFGLFVAKISLAEVRRFEIDYFERRATANDLVQVRADEMRVVTESAHAAKELSLHYLALQPAGASD